jgi:hypothetical protein
MVPAFRQSQNAQRPGFPLLGLRGCHLFDKLNIFESLVFYQHRAVIEVN